MQLMQRSDALRTVRSAIRNYQSEPSAFREGNDAEQALLRCLLYFLIPMWTAAGVADWLWHKQTDIEHTSGIEESLIHMLMFAEAGLPLFMGLALEINAGVLLLMLGALGAHEATAFWDVHYAEQRRSVTEREQHTHSFLEVLPFAAVGMAACLHWGQARALFGAGEEKPDFRPRLKKKRLPLGYLLGVAGIMVAGIAVPYGNELWRCWKARKTA
ncbi:hypothetical protein [Terriglobus sp.]|uniref:hypothetical protein n=1 Tax=Terriglobus sp. TaxID=1889013 RepID=UPI003B001C31